MKQIGFNNISFGIHNEKLRKTGIKYRDESVEGETLQKPMAAGLKILGEVGLHSLFYDLESRGILLEKRNSISLKELCKNLTELFGYEAADMIMERVYKELHMVNTPENHRETVE